MNLNRNAAVAGCTVTQLSKIIQSPGPHRAVPLKRLAMINPPGYGDYATEPAYLDRRASLAGRSVA